MIQRGLVFILTSIWFSSFGQNVPDGFLSNQTQIDSLSESSKYDDALQLAFQNLEIAKREGSHLLLGKAKSKISHLYFRKGDYDSTTYYAKQAMTLASANKLPEVMTSALLSLGNVHYSKFEDIDAIDHYQKIDSISERYGEKNPHVVNALFNLGKVLLRTYSVQDTSYIGKAERYFRSAQKMASEIGNPEEEHIGYIMLGNIYGQRREYEKAIPYFKKSLAYFERMGSSKRVADIYWSLGIIETDLNNYEQAEFYYKKRLDLLTQAGNPEEIANAYRVHAGFLQRINRHREAIPYLEKAYHYFQDSDAGHSGILLGITSSLAESYRKTGDFEKATEFYSQTLVHQDSLDARKQKSLALDLEAKYQTQKKEQEIALLKSQSELADVRKKNQRNILLGGIALISLVALFLFLLYRNRQKTNERLMELDTAKSNFFANISHELRTPLSLIQGPVDHQLENARLSKEDKQNLTIAKKNAERLTTLVDQLLDLSKLESSFYKLQVGRGLLSSFLKSIAESFVFQANKKSQLLNIQISIEEHLYWYDADVLQKIVVNLLGNALKYSPEKAEIHVSANIGDGNLSLSVKNTGISLSKEMLNNIFDRFHRSHENEPGTGIGLALTKELVELHKGKIHVKSDEDSVTFYMEVPVHENAFSINEKDMHSKPTTYQTPYQESEIIDGNNNERVSVEDKEAKDIILIVDDNEDIRTYISSILHNKYHVITAENGDVGFQKALKQVPDLIITDLMMPKDNGLIMTENCKTNDTTSHIPIVMLTAKTGDENRLQGLEIGADSYLTKPFNNKVLKQTVQNLLESRKQLQKRFSQEVILTPKDISIGSYDQRFLESLQTILDEQLVSSDFNAEAFSVAIGMSRMQLHRKLKALTGQTTSEFIRGQRLKLAAKLLQKSDVNISEIGYQVGFNDHSYFTKCFRETYGLSPSEFSKNKTF
nr:tetratricopeptide repeat protein [uncultured Allomuricauda sp.]